MADTVFIGNIRIGIFIHKLSISAKKRKYFNFEYFSKLLITLVCIRKKKIIKDQKFLS